MPPPPRTREARRLQINLPQDRERGLVAEAQARTWQQENQTAIQAWNAHVEEHDVPLAEYRPF